MVKDRIIFANGGVSIPNPPTKGEKGFVKITDNSPDYMFDPSLEKAMGEFVGLYQEGSETIVSGCKYDGKLKYSESSLKGPRFTVCKPNPDRTDYNEDGKNYTMKGFYDYLIQVVMPRNKTLEIKEDTLDGLEGHLMYGDLFDFRNYLENHPSIKIIESSDR